MPLRTYEKSEYKGGDPVPVKVVLTTTKQPWNPPWSETGEEVFFLPAYRSRYEKLLTDNDGPKSKWKPCQHYKRWTPYDTSRRLGFTWTCRNGTEIPHYLAPKTGADPHLAWSNNVPIIKYGPWGDHVKDLPGMTTSTPGSLHFIAEPPNLQQLVNHSLAVMLPGIRSEMSAINFVLELKDLRTLPTTISKLLALSRRVAKYPLRRIPGKSSLIRQIRATFTRESDPTLAEAVRTGADSFLATEFAIRPLLSDLVAYFRIMDRLNKSINDLISRQGRMQVKHFSAHVPVPQYGMAPQVSSTYNLSTGQFAGDMTFVDVPGNTAPQRWLRMGLRMGRESYLTPAEFHAQVQYSYQLDQHQIANAQILGAMDALGINLNPAIIWNAIPFSFIVDWFVNIGSLLQSLEKRNMEPRINIAQYLWSWRFRRHVRTYVESVGAVLPGAYKHPRTYLKELYEEAYRRDVGIPVSSPLILDGLTNKQVCLGVALLIPKKKRRQWRLDKALKQHKPS